MVLKMEKTTTTPTVVEGLVGAELYDLNGSLIAGKLDVLGLMQN